jgi:hypothetical protein
MKYKKTLEISLEVDLEELSQDFIDSHNSNWFNNTTPTRKEMTESLKNEITSWLEALNLEVTNIKGE